MIDRCFDWLEGLAARWKWWRHLKTIELHIEHLHRLDELLDQVTGDSIGHDSYTVCCGR